MITVVGMDGSPLGPQAQAALASAALVAGARRHLAAVPALTASPVPAPAGAAQAHGTHGVRTLVLGELAPALDALAACDGDAVVLASGDPGFFGIVRALRERGLPCTVLPAVSSVAMAFARVGLPWDDAAVVSAHGRDPRPALSVCRAHPKVAVLTGPGCGPAEIGAALAGWARRLVVCEHLGSGAERVTECSPADAAARSWEDPNVVLILAGPPKPADPLASPAPTGTSAQQTAPAPALAPGQLSWLWQQRHSYAGVATTTTNQPGRTRALEGDAGLVGPVGPGLGWALGEEQFDSRDAVITKAEVRALALARLGPGPGMLVWDVGAGSGSVGIECARFGAAVIAVERDAVRCERVRANATRHGVDVRIVAGAAPEALGKLPDPDAVFVGGGGPEVVEAVTARHPARIVVALAAVERAGLATAALAAAGYVTGGALVQAARFAPLPSGAHRLAAINPVFLVWGALPGTTESVSARDHDGQGNRGTGPGALR